MSTQPRTTRRARRRVEIRRRSAAIACRAHAGMVANAITRWLPASEYDWCQREAARLGGTVRIRERDGACCVLRRA